MADSANRSNLRVCVAKICRDVGFNSIQSTPLDVLTDLLQDYIMALARTTYNYALHGGNTEPNLNHLASAFKDMGINIDELKEYVRCVDSSTVIDCPKYPLPKESNLNLLKPGSREVVTRPFHIHEHLPPMHPHLEDQDLSVKQEPLPETSNPETSPATTLKSKSFKRPGEPEGSSKRNRFICDDEERPLRELASFIMTTSGFLSPSREGKLPEPRPSGIRPDFLNQESDSCSNPGSVTDIKVKKKGKGTSEEKKIDKEKNHPEKEEPVEKEEEVVKQKRPNGGKEPSGKKLKIKNNLPSSNNNNSVKVHKCNKLKNMSNSSSTTGSLVKTVKVKSPKSDKNNASSSKDNSSGTLSVVQSLSEYKIASEPDKHKQNILKKISTKAKDELVEEDEKPVIETTGMSKVDVTIESVIKQMAFDETPFQPVEIKEEVVDIETVPSPNSYQPLLVPKIEEPWENGPLTGTTIPVNIKPEKKKKKIKKQKNGNNSDIDTVAPKPVRTLAETKELNDILEEIAEVALATLPPVEMMPLMLSPKPEPVDLYETPIKEEPVEAPEPQVSLNLAPAESNVMYSPPPITIKTEEPEDNSVVKKKLHKKEKKEKLKKKKKDKIKNKDKSEKRKLKLEKKVKDKEEKQRIKKEKKEKRREKEAEDIKPELPTAPASVPKIFLKLGLPSPSSNSTDNSARRIVIIPVVKKDPDEVARPERAPTPELARFSPLVLPKPKHKISDEPKTNTEVKGPFSDLVASSSLPPSVKLDKHGNKVWICPACGRPDDGSPMIACDGCDAWYHWVCVGVQVKPPQTQKWFCHSCLTKTKQSDPEKKKKSKKKHLSKKPKET